ncbi:hypothetical protein [Sphingomonas sp.]|jgi:hypothetical protein|uniref:hypothetical protein n=1 Tax=Sphingomonas sp. TaxID=28214 RepID=UPI002ED9A271
MKTIPFLALTAAALVSACNSQPSAPEVLDANPDPMKNVLANAAPVELPPAIKADKTFRCKDNSLVYVTFFQGDKLASIRTEQTGPVTRLTAPAAGEPLTADGGWTLTGTPASITVTVPGKPSQTCRA